MKFNHFRRGASGVVNDDALVDVVVDEDSDSEGLISQSYFDPTLILFSAQH